MAISHAYAKLLDDLTTKTAAMEKELAMLRALQLSGHDTKNAHHSYIAAKDSVDSVVADLWEMIENGEAET